MAISDSALRFNLFLNDRTGRGAASASGTFKKLAAAGLTLGAVGGAIGSSISKAAEFDKTIRVAGAAAKASGEELKSMSALALEMGTKTQFGAQGAADAMVELSKSGLSIAEQKAGVLAQTMTLASAGGMELGNAATYMTNSLNTFGLKAQDAASVTVALAGGADSSTASVESLGMALSQVGPGAKNAGLSLQETVGVLAAFDNAGVKGSDSGTSLKAMLTRLVPATDKAKGAMKKLGLDFTKADGSFVSITNVAEQLRMKMGKLSEEQRTQTLATLFGSDATRAASILIDQGAKGLEKYIKATKDATAVQRASAAQTEGAAGNMKKFKATVDSLQIAFGLHLLPAVTAVTGAAAGLVTKISGKVDPAMRGIKDTINTVVVPAFAGIKDKVTTALDGIDFSGIGTKLADQAKTWAGSIIGGVKTGFDSGDWGPLGRSVGDGIGMALTGAGTLFITITAWIGSQIKKVNWVDLGVAMGKQAPALLLGLAIGILNFDIGSILTGLGDHWFAVIIGIITLAFLPARVVGAISAMLTRIPVIGPLVNWIFRAAQGASAGIVSAAMHVIGSFGRGLLTGIRTVFPQAGAGIAAGFTALMSAIRSRGTGLVLLGQQLLSSLLRGLAAAPAALARKGGEMIGGFLGGLIRGSHKLLSWVAALGGLLLSNVGDLSGVLFQKGMDWVGGFLSGMNEAAKSLPFGVGKLIGIGEKVLKKVGEYGSPSRLTMKYGRWWTEGFSIGMKDKESEVIASAKSMVDKLKEKVQEVKDFAKDIRTALSSTGNVTSIDTLMRDVAGNESEGGFAALANGLKKKVDDAKTFASTLAKLRKMGLNETSLTNIREAGSEQGLKAAQQILGAGTSGIGEINSLTKSLAAVSRDFAEREAKAQFGYGTSGPNMATIKGGGQKVEVHFDLKNGGGDKFIQAIREAIRLKGGNVQVALGTK